MGQPRTLATLVGPMAGRLLGAEGRSLGRIVADWPSIIGPAWTGRCLAESLTGSRQGQGGTLTLRVEPADALELQHLAPWIIDKVNAYLGFKAVERVRLVHGVVPTAHHRSQQATTDPEDAAAVDALVADVADPGLRERLASLGRGLYHRDRDGGQLGSIWRSHRFRSER